MLIAKDCRNAKTEMHLLNGDGRYVRTENKIVFEEFYDYDIDETTCE